MRRYSFTLVASSCLLLLILFTSTAEDVAPYSEVYARLIACMKLSAPSASASLDWTTLAYPADANAHYLDLINATRHLRQLPVHKAAGYAGHSPPYVLIDR